MVTCAYVPFTKQGRKALEKTDREILAKNMDEAPRRLARGGGLGARGSHVP